MYQTFALFIFIYPFPAEMQRVWGYPVLEAIPEAVKRRWPGTLRDPGLRWQAPWKTGVSTVRNSCQGVCMSARRTTPHHGISKQERLLITPAKEAALF